ncbi:MAG: biosynthetic peptidoglycan transglycosylase [Thermoanaerobaculia bacterium]|nr:biosynthetic peptidoglycan transglycosylase [Thermoanaerobaculia bacterium]
MSLSETLPSFPGTRPGRRLWWILGLVALGVAIVLVWVYRSSEPLVVERVEKRLGRRLGAEVTVGEVRPVLAGAELRDVTIRGPGEFRFRSGMVRAPLDLGGLAVDGATPIGTILLRDVEVVLDPRSEETRSWIRSLAGSAKGSREGEGDDRGGASGLFSGIDLSSADLEIDELSLMLVDARGDRRGLLSKGRFRIDRSGRARTEIVGGATLAGGGHLTLEAADEERGGAIAVSTTDLKTRWILPLLPAGIGLRETEETRLATSVDLARKGAGEPWKGSASLEVRGVTVVSDELAEAPVPLPGLDFTVEELEISGRDRWQIRRGVLDVESGPVIDLEALFQGASEGDRYRVEARVTRSDCQELVEVTPSVLLRDLETMTLGGSYSAALLLDLDMADLEATELELSFDDGCSFRRMPREIRAETLAGPFRIQVPAAEEGRELEIVTGPGSERWVPLNGISRYLKQAVLTHEDADFYEHEGFAPWAIRNSLVENLKAGRFERGASTISMQLAKNLYLSREKVLARKVREVFLTWWLERELSKDEIFALYLNLIEYGPNLYGIGPASRHYFDARPSRLGPVEGVFLATLLPAPKRYHRNYERGSLSSSTESQMRFLLEHMHRKGRITREEMEWGLEALEDFRFGRVHRRGFSLRRLFDPLIDPDRDRTEGRDPGS